MKTLYIVVLNIICITQNSLQPSSIHSCLSLVNKVCQAFVTFVEPQQTFEQGRAREVVENQRNRFKDRIPYDSNIVLLEKPKGTSEKLTSKNIFKVT